MQAHSTNDPVTGRNAPCPCGSGKKFKRCCAEKQNLGPSSSVMDISKEFAAAVIAYENDDLDLAEVGFQKVLKIQADHAGAIHHLGLTLFRQGRREEGVKLIEDSVALNPKDTAYLGNLGVVYLKTSRHEDAISIFLRGLELRPDDAKLQFNLANTYLDYCDYTSAVRYSQTALQLAPQNHDALFTLGVAQYKLGDYAAAFKTLYSRAEQINDHADTYYFLALSTKALGDIDSTKQLLEHAVELNPYKSEYFIELAYVHRDKLEHALAIQYFERALTLPTSHVAEIYSHIGYAYLSLEKFGLALDFAQKGVALKPRNQNTILTLGFTLYKMGRTEEAISRYLEAIELSSDPISIEKDLLFIMQHSANIDEQALFVAHKHYAELLENKVTKRNQIYTNEQNPNKRLRIGYVSADLYDHSLHYFIKPVLEQHDKESVEVYCYYNNIIDDEITRALQAASNHWVSCKNMSDEALATQIQDDAIDILVDLSGHTGGNRLAMFAIKPAPIQITWLGYAGTTGLSAIDYRITDQHLDPLGSTEKFHTEQLLRLSGSATFALDRDLADINALPSMSGKPFTYACLNSHAKFNDETFKIWAEVLRRTPGSRMMFGNANDASVKQHLKEKFLAHGIDESRLLLMPKVSFDEFVKLHHQIDLALDPFPYNGGTTSCISILMGVPVVTLQGTRTVSRCGSALMRGLKLDEFVAETTEQYIELAAGMTQRLEHLSGLRETLRTRWYDSSFGNPNRYTRELESNYRAIWNKWLDKQTD